jgi:hypothetical protein
MTSLLYSNKEKSVYSDFISEAFKLFGIDCVIYDVSSANMYLDDRILDKGVPYKILLQEYVDTRLLANLKWSTIDADREAIVALAPIEYCSNKFNIHEFSVIKLANGDVYQVREVSSQYLLHMSYALKLITYKEEPNRPRNESQMKTNYFNPIREELE